MLTKVFIICFLPVFVSWWLFQTCCRMLRIARLIGAKRASYSKPPPKGPRLTDFPVELLEHIISFLPLSDRKSASLVCRLWNEVAFSRRFLRNVALKLTKSRRRCQCNHLQRSIRRYRNVFISFGWVTCCEYDFVMITEVLDRFGEGLDSFHCMTNLTEEQLWTVMSRAPNLQQLVVGWDDKAVNQLGLNFPVLKHLTDLGSLGNVLKIPSLNVPKLVHLSANFTKRTDAEASMAALHRLGQQLKSLELFSTEYFIPISKLQFPNVRVLKLKGNICEAASDCALGRFFAGFRILKEAKLYFDVKVSVLEIITKTHPEIEKLHFENFPLKLHSFRLLSQLSYLKNLSIVGSIESRISLKCKPLVKVEKFCLELYNLMTSMSGEASVIRSFRKLLPNVTDMSIILTEHNTPKCVLEHVCRNFPHLKKLTITSDHKYCQISSLEALRHLDCLEELTLKCIHTTMSLMLPNKCLRRLTIDDCPLLIDEDLLMLSESYPNLKYLELAWWRSTQVTSWGVEEFRSRLTDCVVHCVQYAISFMEDIRTTSEARRLIYSHFAELLHPQV
ncbi:uncharacterized protein LOC134215129 [Armigeres subalbatus]|uniref:uncharacterized protein LOC134215129 n=1 Tax=Armigeres subalbatus TaxID=124917 RepID=UPI002ED55ACB